MLCAKRGEIPSYQLPPCRYCLVKHAQRANYQAAIWRRCLEQDPKVPSPVGRGWKIEKEEGVEQLVVHSLHWMDEQPVPQAVRTRHPALNQMMRKVQMGKLKN